MAGLEENPFADPMQADPFTDPAVKKATTTNGPKGLEDYNPFADEGNKPTMQVRGAANPPQYAGTGQPAVMQATVQDPTPPPVYKPTGQQTVTVNTSELQKRQEELERKAQELERREAELKQQPYNARTNNWPPLPSWFPFGPCFYQDINVDIALEFQRIVRFLYFLWMYHTLILAVNILGTLALFIEFGYGSTFGLSLLYFILFTPSSYICWFRPVYKAFRSDSSFNFFVFFFVFFFQLVVTSVHAIGIDNLGTCGFINGLKIISKGTAAGYTVGAIVLLIALALASAAVCDFLLLAKVHRIYRSTGASFAKAQEEFTKGVMKNEHVQNAASEAATAAVRSQVNQASGGRF